MAEKRLKIAFLSRFQGSVDRGVETFVYELSKRLSKNHEVEILSGNESDSFGKMISGEYDIVIPANGRWQALKASIGRLFGHYKTVISGQSGSGIDDIFNVFATKPDVFVALTNFAANGRNNKLRRATTWAWGTKVVTIPNGVDLDKFRPGQTPGPGLARLKWPIVLSVGALYWYKHHKRTIKAMVKVQGSLLIVGSGPDLESLQKLGEKLLPGRFRVMPAKYDDMPKIYRNADLFVLPSWEREAFGTVYVEAMASGLPVVAPDDSPRREIIGDAGILVDVENPEKYAEAIEEALSKDWGDKPRQQAEKFSWDLVAEKYKKLFRELV